VSKEHELPRGKRGARVTTRTGDDGYTSLLGADRVPKYSSRPNAFGTLDEATSALGLARSMAADDRVADLVLELQRGLYKLMAELATPSENSDRVDFTMREADVDRLDEISEMLKAEVEIGKRFIIPGDSTCGAALDMARTIVRRGERLVAAMIHEHEVENEHVLQWLNRLSDVVFVLARYVERNLPDGDI
jgi:cob(I)alamin adenosyltransferase